MPLLSLAAITLDCADPEALAAFYERATGWERHPASGAEFAGLTREDGLFLGFQRVEGHREPRWPGQDVPQQSHLDFRVEDLDTAEATLLAWGARDPGWQRDRERFRVLLDPAGHPFCLVVKRD